MNTSTSGDKARDTLSKRVGHEGEKLAAAYLERKGYHILARNYRFRRAEIDLVCFQPAGEHRVSKELVFVEVKTRSSHAYGPPEAAVDMAKQKNLKRAARSYLFEHRLEEKLCRFDVMAITIRGTQVNIHHIESAF